MLQQGSLKQNHIDYDHFDVDVDFQFNRQSLPLPCQFASLNPQSVLFYYHFCHLVHQFQHLMLTVIMICLHFQLKIQDHE